MPLPAAYTESSLLGFMAAELGETGVALGLDADARDTLAEAANEVQGMLGVSLSTLTSTADLVKVRALARWQAWLAAWNVAAGGFDLKAGPSDLKRSQVFAQIEKRLRQAETAALRYDEAAAVLGTGGTAYVSSIGSVGNPYAWPATATEWG